MNDGKICVSVCAETMEEFAAKINRAADFADVIELRFDCLKTLDADKLQQVLINLRKKFRGKLLATYRAPEQGGKNNLSFEQRESFWLDGQNFGQIDWADIELDFSPEKIEEPRNKGVFKKIIRSQHFFDKPPENLDDVYQKIAAINPDVIKIAVQADDITDAIPVWKLIAHRKSDGGEIIPVAMGEAGKWTRILGLAHGAFLTFAALDSDSTTAPGQISARDLIETYRVKELSRQTKVYGVMGANTSYSLSPLMHNVAFKQKNLDAVFLPLQVTHLDEFIRRMVRAETREVDLNFHGFAVTIPHKQAIIKHLDYLDESAARISAVNTVKIADGKLYGYNTDAHGFIAPLLDVYGGLKNAKVAVFGAGGAARACVYALKKETADVTIFARDIEKAKTFADEFQVELNQLPVTNYQLQNFDIVVNTTPLGTKGKLENESILTAKQIQNVKLVYDLVYNPFQTKLMAEADKTHVPRIGGLAMLIAQGAEQFKIWTGKDAPPVEKMGLTVLEILNEVLKRD